METNNIIEQKLRIYQNANNSTESIKQNFVIRTHEYELIIEDLLKKNKTDSIQHELILGRRGSGKSTLLKRIQIEIDENTTLQKKYVAINLPEEQGRIYRLFDLWETVYDELCEKYGIQTSKKDFDEFEDDKEYTNYIFGLLHELLDKKKLIAVLLLDNFDRILDNIKAYSNTLREILLNYNDIKIIAGSTRMAEHFWKYDYPFYEFFRVHRLGALTSDEIKTLLKHWSKILEIPQLENFIYEKPGQLEAIRILTDGLPRTLQFFIKILIEHSYTNGYDYLNHIFDKVSPLYQERLDKLTPSHRKIVMEMAFIWHGCTVQQLVDKCKMESKLISANLKQLDQYGIVETRKTGKKNNIYFLAERFFNIWLLGTQGNPSERRKAKYLTIFLENFYNKDELKELAINHIKKLQNKELDYDKALLHSKALAQSKYITTKERDQIIELTENLGNVIKDCKIELPEKASKIFERTKQLIEKENFKEALILANEIEQEEDGLKDLMISNIYYKKGDLKLAIPYAENCYNKGHKLAINLLGILYFELNEFANAEKYFLESINNKDYDVLGLLALTYSQENKFDHAKKYFLLAAEHGDKSANFNLGLISYKQQKINDAEKYYKLSADLDNNDVAMYNLASIYINQNKQEEAELYLLKSIKLNNKNAVYNLGCLYDNQNNFEKAEKYYLLACKVGDINAIYNVACLYFEHNIFKEAERYFLLSIQKEKSNAIFNLALLYYVTCQKEKLNNFLEKYNFDSNAFRELKFIASIWNGKMQNILENAKQLIILAEFNDIDTLLINLLKHHQQNTVLQLFEDVEIGKKLMERYIPIYFATLLLKNKEDAIKLSIPPEIKNTVDELISMVKDGQKQYYP